MTVHIWQLVKMEEKIERFIDQMLVDKLETQDSAQYYSYQQVKEMEDIVNQFKKQLDESPEKNQIPYSIWRDYAFFIDSLITELFMFLQENRSEASEIDLFTYARDIKGFIASMHRLFLDHHIYVKNNKLYCVYDTVPQPRTFLFHNNKIDYQD